MPSRPDPESPFMDSRLQAAFGIRTPGSPTSAGKPGVQMGDVSFPAPPGINAAPAGRPAAPAAPAPVASTPQGLPPQPGGERPPQGQGAGASSVTVNVGGSGGSGSADRGAAAAGGAQPAPSAQPSPEAAAQSYREAVIRLRTELGPLPRVFRQSNLPEMPVEPGFYNYNPFTGRWSR